jgi:Trypsin-like peptidase domain
MNGPALAVVVALATSCSATSPEEPVTCESLPEAPQALLFRPQCGPSLDLIPINRYGGTIAGVQEREEAVVLINGSCTGTLIAAGEGPVVITAGHCVGLEDDALVAFNIEDEPDGERLATSGVVIERAEEPDYALIELDQLPDGVTPVSLTTSATDLLAIIQHPRGAPKVIGEGRFLDTCDAILIYSDLDTLVGSSGAGVLNQQGHFLGIHVGGDCAEDGSGSNRGWSAQSVVQASAHLRDDDIAER